MDERRGEYREGYLRQRLVEAAAEQFVRHSYAGTSLQMIADYLGISKGNIYHHFRTRDELLRALVAPVLSQFEAAVTNAEAARTDNARADAMLQGYATLAVRNRALVAMAAGDAGVIEVINAEPDWRRLNDRAMALLGAVGRPPRGRIRAAVVMGGIASAAAPGLVTVDEEVLRAELIEAGRRTLGIRPSRSDAGPH